MIEPRQGFTKRYVYGGSGIFDSITKLLMRLFTSNAELKKKELKKELKKL